MVEYPTTLEEPKTHIYLMANVTMMNFQVPINISIDQIINVNTRAFASIVPQQVDATTTKNISDGKKTKVSIQ